MGGCQDMDLQKTLHRNATFWRCTRFWPLAPPHGMDPGVWCPGIKANPTEYLWSKYECFLMSGCQDMSRDMRKPDFCICENKDADQLRGNLTAKLISAFVFASWIVQSLCFLNPKFQASSHLQWLHSPVCVGPGRKPGRLVFWRRGS